MTTLRQKRHHEIELTLARVEEQRDRHIAALVRVEAKRQGLLKAKNRLERTMAKESPVPVSVAEGKLLPEVKPAAVPEFDDGIPDILRRNKLTTAAVPTDVRDLEARVEIETQAANTRIEKSRVRIEKMKAKQSGDTRKMPLTGKEALNYIRTGSRAG